MLTVIAGKIVEADEVSTRHGFLGRAVAATKMANLLDAASAVEKGGDRKTAEELRRRANAWSVASRQLTAVA